MYATIYTRQDICQIAGVDYSTLSYHTKIGNVPVPGIWGGAYAYSQEELDGIVKFFSTRKKWSRAKNTVTTT